MSTELSSTDLQSILEFTTALSRTAGKLILEGSEAIQASGTFDEKKNSVDLVTEYDVRVEELVKKALGEKYPGYNLSVPPDHLSVFLRRIQLTRDPMAYCAQ